MEKFSKFVPSHTVKMHSLALSVLRLLCTTFSKFLFVDVFKKIIYSYNIQIKILYGYKLVRAAERSEKIQEVVQKELHEAA